ncbi:MAG: quinone-dependent dihydroorotate dehydrogenase [Sphingomonadaceae bacterium]
MSLVFDAVRPALFMLRPETAHRATIAGLRLLPSRSPALPDTLACRVAGIDFPSPVGLAAGFDKDAEVPDAMLGLGFGFVEVGTLTPLPQSGNAKPRLFRLVADAGVINRLGFNNGGQAAALARLEARRRDGGIVGVNIGANKDSADRIADYVAGVSKMAAVADYLTINISSPNTPGLRGLQDAGALTELLDAVNAVNAVRAADGPPLFLKLAPDLEPPDIDAIVKVAHGRGTALIIGNTTISRPTLRSAACAETGGLSGAPLKALAMQRLRDFRAASGGDIALVAAGGIDGPEEAYARIRAGASLVQLYTALVFQGPGLAMRIAQGLATLLARDGFATISDAVGVDAA